MKKMVRRAQEVVSHLPKTPLTWSLFQKGRSQRPPPHHIDLRPLVLKLCALLGIISTPQTIKLDFRVLRGGFLGRC